MDPKTTMQTPEEHRLEEELRRCDPDKVGHDKEVSVERIARMAKEIEDGFHLLSKYRLGATFFGSARCGVGEEYYEAARLLAGRLSRAGFSIVTGGASGIMEAANRGAFEAGGQSVGLNIKLPHEQGSNEYLTEEKTFNYFFSRKVMLTFASEVYLYFPGGFGTFDELFEILTLIQTKKIKRVPIILYGRKFWEPVIAMLRSQMAEEFNTISASDLELFTLVDSVDEAYDAVLAQVKC